MSRLANKLETLAESIETVLNAEREKLSELKEKIEAGNYDKEEVLATLSEMIEQKEKGFVGEKPFTLKVIKQIFSDLSIVKQISGGLDLGRRGRRNRGRSS